MEEPLPPPALPHVQSSPQSGAVSTSCQPSRPSAPWTIPPIVGTSSPGAGPLEALHLGCDQASTFELAALRDLVELDHESLLWCIPTLVSAPRTNNQATKPPPSIPVRPYGHGADSNSAAREISISEPDAHFLDSLLQRARNYIAVNDLSLKFAQGSHLEIRSLTTSPHVHLLNMTTTVANAPGSPPDLSGSRSSKASSYSSTFSSPDGLESDITNFEEIGLEDDKVVPSNFCHSRDISVQSVGSQHELMRTKDSAQGEKRPTLPQLQTHVKTTVQRQDQALPRPAGSKMATLKRGFTSAETFYSQGSMRTRSSSPPIRRHPSYSTPSLSAGGLRPIPQTSVTSLGLPPRRASWQPHRKTVKELEAEYHDSDDELPDDASLWNVPISPHLSGERSHRSSFRGSPERDQPTPSPRPIPLAHAITAPETPPKSSLHSQTLPKNRPPPSRSISLTPATSNPSSPRKAGYLLKGRTKSWNLAISDLSEEARVVSEALEYHAETKSQEQRDSNREGSWDSLESAGERASRSSSIQLPPIQKSTLDFMPMSREKEAILSRTRPSWLPPKNPKEERKHLKEYQRMMAASIEAEKKRRAKLQDQQWKRDDTRESLNRIWTYYIDETTDITTIDKRVNDLCWRGISPNLRGKVWQRAIGNPLGLTTNSYEKALQRAKNIKGQPSNRLDKNDRSVERWFMDIERDAETAFPELNLFQRNAPLWQDLIDVCEAYACYRSDVGYIYGIQLIAALLLLQFSSPAEAFVLLANCLNRPVPLAFQIDDTATTGRTYNHAISILGVKFPRLHEYLFGSVEQGGLGFRGEEVFEPMLRTIFANGLDVDRLCRVWDIWVFEGDRTLVRTAVGVLGSLQSQLFDMAGDLDLKRRNIQEMLGWGPFNRNPTSGHWNLQTIGDEEKFVEEIMLAGTLDYTGK